MNYIKILTLLTILLLGINAVSSTNIQDDTREKISNGWGLPEFKGLDKLSSNNGELVVVSNDSLVIKFVSSNKNAWTLNVYGVIEDTISFILYYQYGTTDVYKVNVIVTQTGIEQIVEGVTGTGKDSINEIRIANVTKLNINKTEEIINNTNTEYEINDTIEENLTNNTDIEENNTEDLNISLYNEVEENNTHEELDNEKTISNDLKENNIINDEQKIDETVKEDTNNNIQIEKYDMKEDTQPEIVNENKTPQKKYNNVINKQITKNQQKTTEKTKISKEVQNNNTENTTNMVKMKETGVNLIILILVLILSVLLIKRSN